jgi:hypothetical protein
MLNNVENMFSMNMCPLTYSFILSSFNKYSMNFCKALGIGIVWTEMCFHDVTSRIPNLLRKLKTKINTHICWLDNPYILNNGNSVTLLSQVQTVFDLTMVPLTIFMFYDCTKVIHIQQETFSSIWKSPFSWCWIVAVSWSPQSALWSLGKTSTLYNSCNANW